MPVKWLLHWQPSAGSLLVSQTLVDVMKCIESINAVKAGRWLVTASHHRPILRDQGMPVDCTRELLGVTLSDAPSKYFFVLRGDRMVVEADATMQDVMEKLQLYANRMSLVFEGFQYQLGDFQLKAGRAVLSYETTRGIVLEVEYLPICSVEQGRAVLQDFVSSLSEVFADSGSLLGQFVHLEPGYAEYGLGDSYSWQHTALQYVSLMAFLMSQARSGL